MDITLFKKELSHIDFSGVSLWADSGFQGLDACLGQEQQLFLPFKKQKGKERTEYEKEHNRFISQRRVIVENAIGGVKRYNILKYANRLKDRDKIEKAQKIATGLWNFKKGATVPNPHCEAKNAA